LVSFILLHGFWWLTITQILATQAKRQIGTTPRKMGKMNVCLVHKSIHSSVLTFTFSVIITCDGKDLIDNVSDDNLHVEHTGAHIWLTIRSSEHILLILFRWVPALL
jgi:hypothetical protein